MAVLWCHSSGVVQKANIYKPLLAVVWDGSNRKKATYKNGLSKVWAFVSVEKDGGKGSYSLCCPPAM